MAQQKRREFPVRGAIITLVIVALGLLFLSPSFFSNTMIFGEEFSPNHFSERTFSYSRLPWPRLRLSKTRLSVSAGLCSKHVTNPLANTRYSKSPLVWQVSKVQYGSQSGVYGPKILVNYLKMQDADGNKVWDAWSFRNTELADEFWPIVQEAAFREIYGHIPRLFQAAEKASEDATDPIALRRELKLICLRGVLETQDLARPINASTVIMDSETTDAKNESSLEWAKSFANDLPQDRELEDLLAQFH
jgi:hypothetical protein